MPRKALYSRDEALERAVGLFWSKGFNGCSLKDIEQALDMRPGSLYHAFGSKETLFLEALDVYANRMADELDACLNSASSPLSGLELYIQTLAQACVHCDGTNFAVPACMIVKTLLEMGVSTCSFQEHANALLEQVEWKLSSVLDEARAHGELRQDVDTERLARFIQAQIMGLRVFAERRIEPDKVNELAEDIVRLLNSFRASA